MTFCASAFSNKSLIEETTKRLLRTSLGPKLAGTGLGEHPNKFGTPYLTQFNI